MLPIQRKRSDLYDILLLQIKIIYFNCFHISWYWYFILHQRIIIIRWWYHFCFKYNKPSYMLVQIIIIVRIWGAYETDQTRSIIYLTEKQLTHLATSVTFSRKKQKSDFRRYFWMTCTFFYFKNLILPIMKISISIYRYYTKQNDFSWLDWTLGLDIGSVTSYWICTACILSGLIIKHRKSSK